MAVEERVNDLPDEVDCLHDSLLQGIEILLTASLQDAASPRSTPTLVAVDDGALIGALDVLGDDLTVEASRTPVVRGCRWRPAMPVDEDYVMEGHKMSLAPHAVDYRLLTAADGSRFYAPKNSRGVCCDYRLVFLPLGRRPSAGGLRAGV